MLQELLFLQTSYVIMERPQVLLPLQDAGVLARFVNITLHSAATGYQSMILE
jgi:hypothetical protein